MWALATDSTTAAHRSPGHGTDPCILPCWKRPSFLLRQLPRLPAPFNPHYEAGFKWVAIREQNIKRPLFSNAPYFMNPFRVHSGRWLHVRCINFCSVANEQFMVGLFHSINWNIEHLIHVATRATKDSCSFSSLPDLWTVGTGELLVF